MLVTMNWISPPSSAVAARPALLYGTCVALTPAIVRNSSLARWLAVPCPAEPNASLPGSAFMISSSSFSDLAREDAFTAMMLGWSAIIVMGSKSLTASYPGLS